MTNSLGTPTIGERQAIAAKAREIFEAECVSASELLPKARVVGIDVFERLVVELAPPAILSLDSPSLGEGVVAAAVNQNDAMRQELAHVGDLVSDLARRLGVDQANDDGTWPDLASRIQKLIAATPTTNAPVADLREAIALIVNDGRGPAGAESFGGLMGHSLAARMWEKSLAKADAILSLTKNVATNADMRGALERIAKAKIGLQNVVEDYGHDANAYNYHASQYWQRLATSYQDIARTVLQGDQS